MPVVVDTYNVLHVTGVLPAELAGLGPHGLVELVQSSRYGGEAVTLACDGRPGPAAPSGRKGSVVLRYAGLEGAAIVTADDLIIRMIERSSAPRRLTVVSSDRAVRRAARRRRCPTLSAEDFLRQLAADHAADGSRGTVRPPSAPGAGPLSDAEVDAWTETFDVGDLEIEAAAPPERPAAVDAADEPVDPASAPSPPSPAGADLPPAIIDEAESLWRDATSLDDREGDPDPGP